MGRPDGTFLLLCFSVGFHPTLENGASLWDFFIPLFLRRISSYIRKWGIPSGLLWSLDFDNSIFAHIFTIAIVISSKELDKPLKSPNS